MDEYEVISPCEEEYDPLSFGQLEGDLMEGKLDVELDSFLLDVNIDSFVGGTENLRFDQNAYLSTNQSLENIYLNGVVPDTKFTSVSDTCISTRNTFRKLYSKTFYSLYPNLFTKHDGMILIDDLFAKHFFKYYFYESTVR